MKNIYKIILPLMALSTSAMAQKVIYYTGLGRGLMMANRLDPKSAILKGDTTVSQRRDLSGQFVFDLGINIKPNKDFKALAVLRMYNPLGGFFSAGSVFQFRQVTINGTLADKISYKIGDIDLKQSQYSLYNNDETYYEFEAGMFKDRRDIVNYENFYIDNQWRLQGVQANTKLLFDKGIENISINAFGTRVRKTNYQAQPDRLLSGVDLDVRQSKYVVVGGHLNNISDIVGTALDTVLAFNNTIGFGTVGLDSIYLGTVKLSLDAEMGMSYYKYERRNFKDQREVNDAYRDVSIGATPKNFDIGLSIAYRYVGPDFSSPGAQTRRVYANTPSAMFPSGLNGTFTRNQHLFDRMNDAEIYTQTLLTQLGTYNPAYNNVTPYGKATPNRKGITLDMKRGNRDSLYYTHAEAQFLTEAVGEGIANKRNFTSIKGGFVLNANPLYAGKKALILNAGIRYENTKREGLLPTSVQSSLLDLGLSYEFAKKLNITTGFKSLNAKGNDYYTIRNAFNSVTGYQDFKLDLKQNFLGLGLKYNFSEKAYLAVNYTNVLDKNKAVKTEDYTINQWYFAYVVQF